MTEDARHTSRRPTSSFTDPSDCPPNAFDRASGTIRCRRQAQQRRCGGRRRPALRPAVAAITAGKVASRPSPDVQRRPTRSRSSPSRSQTTADRSESGRRSPINADTPSRSTYSFGQRRPGRRQRHAVSTTLEDTDYTLRRPAISASPIQRRAERTFANRPRSRPLPGRCGRKATRLPPMPATVACAASPPASWSSRGAANAIRRLATPRSPSRCRTTAAPPTAASISIRRPTR